MKIVVFATLMWVVTSSGVHAAITPRPLTPTQAAAAISAQGPALDPTSDFVSASCRGTARKAPGRFLAFRCVAVLEASRLVLLAKVRRAGGLCWGVSVVPSGCLAAGRRATGSIAAASTAVYRELGAPSQSFAIRGHGSGFYSWTWLSGGVEKRGSVTFGPTPVVRTL